MNNVEEWALNCYYSISSAFLGSLVLFVSKNKIPKQRQPNENYYLLSEQYKLKQKSKEKNDPKDT